jgi:hypothetical protein
MVCTQLKVYVGFYIIQFILALTVLNQKPNGQGILGGFITAGVIYLLCIFNFKLIANIILGLLIGIAVVGDITILMLPLAITKAKHILEIKTEEKTK